MYSATWLMAIELSFWLLQSISCILSKPLSSSQIPCHTPESAPKVLLNWRELDDLWLQLAVVSYNQLVEGSAEIVRGSDSDIGSGQKVLTSASRVSRCCRDSSPMLNMSCKDALTTVTGDCLFSSALIKFARARLATSLGPSSFGTGGRPNSIGKSES